MAIPEGSQVVNHSTYASHLLKHELGLIQAATKDDGTGIEVEVDKSKQPKLKPEVQKW